MTTVPFDLAQHPIVPVIVIDDAGAAPDLADALIRGGIRCAEITLRTPDAFAAITSIAGRADFAAGAGTVLSLADLERVADAGAVFAVSPGFDPDLVERARALGIAMLPGIATATEAQHALRTGVRTVKFFPADRLGGLATISALAAPFPELRFVPSGGVSEGNLVEYLGHPAVRSVSGSWMAPRDLLAAGDFSQIETRSRQASGLAAAALQAREARG
jgi:2-dehydro-3-deoxyphosphogluconate aldolase/(4S)-4-hydroxy-2-oxoglutarate aldolase